MALQNCLLRICPSVLATLPLARTGTVGKLFLPPVPSMQPGEHIRQLGTHRKVKR